MERKKICLMLAFLAASFLLPAPLTAQTALPIIKSLGDLNEGNRHLQLMVDGEYFFLDAENGMPIAKGYTVTGFRLTPTLVYGINERAQIRLGFNAVAFAGLDSLYHLRPVFSLVYRPTRWLRLVAGTIYGGRHHNLGAPAYDPTRMIFHPQEEGLQIVTNTRRWNSDTWLDWHHYLTPWTPDQEQFTMGSRHEIVLVNSFFDEVLYESDRIADNKTRCFVMSVPLHFVADHRGGEVKTIDTNTVTTFNERAGIRLFFDKYDIAKTRYGSLTIDLPFYFYHLEDKELDNGGWAFYPTVGYEFKKENREGDVLRSWSLTAGYWHGDHYFSAHGSPQFWSIYPYSALHIPSAVRAVAAEQRDMLTLSFGFSHEFKGIDLGFKVDAYHDFDMKETDFLFGFTVGFKERFKLF